MSPFEKLNSIKEEELSDFFEENNEKQKARQRKKWKENRAEFLKDKELCEWCGDEPEMFQVHHTWNRNYGRQWSNAADEAFVESNQYNSSLTKSRQECPDCGKRDFYSRKTKNPEYRCSNCESTFDSPKDVRGKYAVSRDKYDTKPYTTFEYYKKKAEWVDNNRDAVHEKFEQRYQNVIDEYVSLREDQVVAICNSCHFKFEQTSQRLCSKCNSNFHKPNRSMCWDCIVKKEGLEKCSSCGEGWYQPEKYDSCSSCRND